MSHTPWMIYGAAGTNGTLIAEEAIRRGHQPRPNTVQIRRI
jgi:short subunit dehydrogenase-like uncharacterized protein